MVTNSKIKIYAEGGGDGQLYDAVFRRAFSSFFRAAGLDGKMPSVVRGGGRQRTFDLFTHAVKRPKVGVLPLLLVDSEGPVTEGISPWSYLEIRDQWIKPESIGDDRVFLMVQMMETWFLADRDLLKSLFGSRFRENHLKQWPALEAVPKADVLKTLERATAACPRQYTKGKTSFELLERLNPQAVEQACPHAKKLLSFLRSHRP